MLLRPWSRAWMGVLLRFLVSAEAALNKEGPVLDNLIAEHPGWSLAQIFQTMNNVKPWNTGPDKANYGQKVQGVINSVDSRIKCLEKNHYVETPSGN